MEREKLIVLTFDDCPEGNWEAILETLKEKDAKATFFVVGEKLKRYPEFAKRAAEDGHDVGWASEQYSLDAFKTPESTREDIKNGVKLITELAGVKPKFIRCPEQYISEAVAYTSNEEGLKIVNFSNCSFIDDKAKSIPPKERADATIDETVYGIHNGDIVKICPYDNDEITVGIGLMIDRFKEEGYRVISLSQLFKARPNGVSVYYSPIF